jgi:hypothetical protein
VKLTQLHVAAIAVISEIVAALKLSLVTRHVRGHRPGPGRQWVNGEVDRIARTAMRDRHARPPAATRRGRSSDKALVLNFINTVTYFVPEGRESDSAVLGWGTHHAVMTSN